MAKKKVINEENMKASAPTEDVNDKEIVEETKTKEEKEVSANKTSDSEVTKKLADYPVDDPKNVLSPEEIAKLPFAEKVEATRRGFIQKYRKYKMINNIVSFGALALMVGDMIGFMSINPAPENKWNIWTALAIAIVLLVFVFLYMRVMRKKMETMTKDYVQFIFDTFNDYSFAGEKYSSVTADAEEQYTLEDFNNAKIYADIVSVRGRNMVHADISGASFQVSELVANTQVTDGKKKKTTPIFVGKYIVASNTVDTPNKIIIYIKGKSDLVSVPSDIGDLPIVADNESYAIYAEGKEYKKIVNKQILSSLKKLEINDIFLDATISIQTGKTYIAINYDDKLMILPFQNKFTPEPMKIYKDNLDVLADIIKELN